MEESSTASRGCSTLLDLPHDMLVEILSHVALPERLNRMAFVCRAFRSAVSDSVQVLDFSSASSTGPGMPLHRLRQVHAPFARWVVLGRDKPCDWVTDEHLAVLGSRVAATVHVLEVGRCRFVTDAGLCSWLRHARGALTVLDVSHTAVTDAGLADAVAQCPALQCLQARYTAAGDLAVHALAAHCPGLRQLELDRTPITDASLCALAVAPAGASLRELSLRYCNVGERGLVPITYECMGLVRLDLTGCARIRDASVFYLSRSSGHTLTQLSLDGTGICSASLRYLSQRCVVLRTLDLSNCALAVMDGTGLVPLLQASASTLRSLHLANCDRLKDETLDRFPAALEVLVLSGCSVLTDRCGLKLVAACPMLRSLRLDGCPKLTHHCVRDLMDGLSRLESVHADPIHASPALQLMLHEMRIQWY